MKNMSTTSKVISGIAVVIIIILLARFVVFKKQFDQWGTDLQRLGNWENEYREENPNATDAEVDAAFDAGMANLKVWREKYKRDHPDATEAEIDVAFDNLWK